MSEAAAPRVRPAAGADRALPAGELVVFTLGAAIVVFEVNRQALLKEAKVRSGARRTGGVPARAN